MVNNSSVYSRCRQIVPLPTSLSPPCQEAESRVIAKYMFTAASGSFAETNDRCFFPAPITCLANKDVCLQRASSGNLTDRNVRTELCALIVYLGNNGASLPAPVWKLCGGNNFMSRDHLVSKAVIYAFVFAAKDGTSYPPPPSPRVTDEGLQGAGQAGTPPPTKTTTTTGSSGSILSYKRITSKFF